MTIGLYKRIESNNFVTITTFFLLLNVAGVIIMHGILKFVVSWSVMFILVSIFICMINRCMLLGNNFNQLRLGMLVFEMIEGTSCYLGNQAQSSNELKVMGLDVAKNCLLARYLKCHFGMFKVYEMNGRRVGKILNNLRNNHFVFICRGAGTFLEHT